MVDDIDSDFGFDLDRMTVEEIKGETTWPLEYTSTVGLVPYLRRMKGDLVGLEIGTGRGESAYLILETCPNVKKLLTVDHFKEYQDWNALIPQSKQDLYKEIAYKNLATFGDRVEIVVGESGPLLDRKLELESFDFIFIDGDHDYKAVLEDMRWYYPYLKQNGIMAVHDTNLAPVREAIKAFRHEAKIRQPLHNSANGLSFWYKFGKL